MPGSTTGGEGFSISVKSGFFSVGLLLSGGFEISISGCSPRVVLGVKSLCSVILCPLLSIFL